MVIVLYSLQYFILWFVYCCLPGFFFFLFIILVCFRLYEFEYSIGILCLFLFEFACPASLLSTKHFVLFTFCSLFCGSMIMYLFGMLLRFNEKAFKNQIELRMEWGMCQRDNNPTIKQTTAEGHQQVFNAARHSRTQRRPNLVGMGNVMHLLNYFGLKLHIAIKQCVRWKRSLVQFFIRHFPFFIDSY